MTPKAMADAATLFAPRTAFQWGEGPSQGLPGNGWGQHLIAFQSPAYGATITYRLQRLGHRPGARDGERRRGHAAVSGDRPEPPRACTR